jgi:phosphohistidine phosphatase
MELYFLRHGLAGQYGDPKYKDDSLRPLTAQGREKMHRAALGMKALGLKFDAFLSSPYLRARQTAKIVAQVFKMENKKIHITNRLLGPASIEELLREIHAHFPKSKNIVLVGHEPHLTQMVSSLLQSKESLDIDLKKGGLCCLKTGPEAKQPNAALIWLLTPTQLELMA